MKKATPPGSPSEAKIPLLEERAILTKQDVTKGRVRLSTHVENIAEVVRADLLSDNVEITRVTVDQRVVGPPPQIRTEGDATVVPIFEEVLVVEKQLFLKEEIHIRRRQETEAVEVPLTLRRQSADVERSEGER